MNRLDIFAFYVYHVLPNVFSPISPFIYVEPYDYFFVIYK